MNGLDDLLQAVGLQNTQDADTAAKITGNYEQVQQIGEQRALATTAAGDDDAIVAQQKGVGVLQAQQNSRQFATDVGSNMDDSSQIMSALGMQLQQANMETIRAKSVVAQKQSVKLLDDPVQYLMNQITVGDDINYANAAQDKSDQIASSLAQINQATQSTAVSQNAIAATTSAAAVQAGTDSIKQKAIEQADQVKQQNLLYNVDGLMKVQSLNQQELSNLFSAQNATNSQKQLEIAQGHLEIARQSNALLLEQRLDAINEKKTNLAEIQDIGDTVNKGRSILGLAPIPAGKAVQFMKIGGDLGNSIKDQYSKGAVAIQTGVNVISDQPGKAAITIAQSQAPLSPTMAPVKNLLMNSLADVGQGVVKGANGLPVDLKNPQAVTGAANGLILTRAAGMASNIKVGDNTNIYAAPTLPSILKVAPGVMQTDLYNKVLAPLVNTGLTTLDPNQILSLTSQSVARGEMSFTQSAQDIKVLFSAAAATNNVTKDYARVGLPNQMGYNTSVTLHNASTPNVLAFATNQNVKVNMTDLNQVGSILARQMAADRGSYNMNLKLPATSP